MKKTNNCNNKETNYHYDDLFDMDKLTSISQFCKEYDCYTTDIICSQCNNEKTEHDRIKTVDYEVKCPKCHINHNRLSVAFLPIILMSDTSMVFECSNCNHHIPVKYVRKSDFINLVLI